MAVVSNKSSSREINRKLELHVDKLKRDTNGEPKEKRLKLAAKQESNDSCDEESNSYADMDTSPIDEDKFDALGSEDFKLFSKNTLSSTKWAVATFRLWAAKRNANTTSQVPDDLLENPPKPCVLSKWLSSFITEVRNREGKLYPPKTIWLLLFGLQRYVRNVTPSYPGFLVRSGHPDFAELHKTREKLQLHRNAIAIKSNPAKPLTNDDEKQLWSSGVLDPDSPVGLLRAVYFNNEKKKIKL